MCSRTFVSLVLYDDLKKYISIPPPLQLEKQTQGKAEPKVKEGCVVREDDDAIVIEDTSNNEDENTLQQCFQLRSRFIRAGMPHVPVVEKPYSLEKDLPPPPRKPCNMARKRTLKKPKACLKPLERR
jgi:hypothetical protein